jgi:hypothetical protein
VYGISAGKKIGKGGDMKGLEMVREGDKLILTVDMTQGQVSSTGKSYVRFNSRDFLWSEDGDYAVKLFVIEPTAKEEDK